MKKLGSIFLILIFAVTSSNASAQQAKLFDYNSVDSGFTEEMKSSAHIIILKDPVILQQQQQKNTRCGSEEILGEKLSYRTLALVGAMVSNEHYAAIKLTAQTLYEFARPPNDLVWFMYPKVQKTFTRKTINDFDTQKEFACNTFILTDEDYPIVKNFLKRYHTPTKNGTPFYFEKSYSFDTALATWSKFLGYTDINHYVNGFMKFNLFTNDRAYKAFNKFQISNEIEIKNAIDRANSVGYKLSMFDTFQPHLLLSFLREEALAVRNGQSLAESLKASEETAKEAEFFKNNPHKLTCGVTVNCQSAADIINKMAEAVLKLSEAGKPNGKYSYKYPSSKLDGEGRLNRCVDAYNKARRLSINVGDLMSQSDNLLSQCNGVWQINY